MRDTIFTLSEIVDRQLIINSVNQMVEDVRKYVPGYELHQEIQFEIIEEENPIYIENLGMCHGLKTMIMLKVKGAGHYFPEYAGNLDIMTSAAKITAEMLVNMQ